MRNAILACGWFVLVAVGLLTLLGNDSWAQATPGEPDVIITDVKTGNLMKNPDSNKSFIRALKEGADNYLNRRVTITGTVGPEQETSVKSSVHYFNFLDGYGESMTLKVDLGETSEEAVYQKGRQGQDVTIWAVLAKGDQGPILCQPIFPRATQPSSEEKETGGKPKPATVLLIAAGVVLVVVIALVLYLMYRSPQAGSGPLVGPVTMPPAGAANLDQTQKVPSTVISSTGRSVVAEPDTTVKMLPGYLEILSGTAKGRRVNIFNPLTTIGRLRTGEDARGLSHIGFDPAEKTISREQAELRFNANGGRFVLKNLADPVLKNSTLIAGREMKLDEEVVLKDGDKLQFGTIELVFHALGAGA